MLSQVKFNKIVGKSIILISFTIPFWMLINNIAIIFAVFLGILNLILFNNNSRQWHPIFSLYVFMFFLMIVSLIYTENLKMGFTRLGQRSLYLLMPFICFSLSNILNRKVILKAMKYFVIAILLCSSIFFINACANTIYFASLNPFNEVNGNFFSYIKFTSIIEDTHPIYFGTYVLFSIFILVNDYFKNDLIFKVNNYFRIFLICFLIIVVFLLNSFLLTSLIAVFFLYLFFKLLIDNRLKIISKIVLFLLFLLLVTISSGFVLNKYKGITLKKDLINRDFSGSDFTAVRARVAKIYSSLELISDNFLFGVGVGDEIDELLLYYEKNNFLHGVEKRYNSHNQYLTEFISTGFIGFLALVICFVIIFNKGIINNYYLLSLGIIYFCFCLTESALIRNKGIVFFLFFSCGLFFLNKNNKTIQ